MKRVLLPVFILIAFVAFSQKPDTLIRKLDSLSQKTDSAGGQANDIQGGAYNKATRLNFSTYFILLGSDLKQAFSKPFHMTGKDWAGRVSLR